MAPGGSMLPFKTFLEGEIGHMSNNKKEALIYRLEPDLQQAIYSAINESLQTKDFHMFNPRDWMGRDVEKILLDWLAKTIEETILAIADDNVHNNTPSAMIDRINNQLLKHYYRLPWMDNHHHNDCLSDIQVRRLDDVSFVVYGYDH